MPILLLLILDIDVDVDIDIDVDVDRYIISPDTVGRVGLVSLSVMSLCSVL